MVKKSMMTELTEYALINLPSHLAHLKRYDQLNSILTEFRWIKMKLSLVSPSAIAEDYNYLPEEYSNEGFRLIQRAIQLSSPYLNKDINFIEGQLAGRLLSINNTTAVNNIINELNQQTYPWLRPLTATLTSPVEPLFRTLIGHTQKIHGIVYLQDLQSIISCSDDNTIKIWNKNTGECLHTLTEHSSSVLAISVTEDRQYIVSFDFNAEIRFWNLKNGICDRVIKCKEEDKEAYIQIDSNVVSGPNAVTVTRCNHLIFPSDKRIFVWDLISGKCSRILEGHNEKINHIVVTPDGHYALSGAHDGNAKFWDIFEGKCLWTLRVPELEKSIADLPRSQSINVLWIADDASRAIICVCFWSPVYLELDLFTMKAVHVWQINRRLYGLNLLPNSCKILSYAGPPVKMSMTEAFYLWDINTGKILFNFAGLSTGRIGTVAVTQDGQAAIAGYGTGELKIWDLHNLDLYSKFQELPRHTRKVRDIIISSDGLYAVSGAGSEYDSLNTDEAFKAVFDQIEETPIDNTIKIWDIKTGSCINTLNGHKSYIRSLAFGDNNCILSNSNDKTVKIWGLKSLSNKNALICTLENMEDVMVVSPDKKIALLSDTKNNILIWNIETKKIEITLKGHTRRITHLKFTSDSKHAISISEDLTIKTWDLSTGKYISWKGHSTFIHDIIITKDGRKAITAAYDTKPKIWDLHSGRYLSLQGHTDNVNSLDISPDEQYIATCSKDQTVKVWKLASGRLIYTFKDHSGSVRSVKFTPGGEYVVSGSDNIIKVWDMQSGVLFKEFPGRSNSIQFSIDNQWIIYVDNDNKTLWIRDLSLNKPLAGFATEEDISTYTISPDGLKLVIGDKTGRIHFLELVNVKPSHTNVKDLVLKLSKKPEMYNKNRPQVVNKKNKSIWETLLPKKNSHIINKVYIYHIDSMHNGNINRDAQYNNVIMRMCREYSQFSKLWHQVKKDGIKVDKHYAIRMTSGVTSEMEKKYTQPEIDKYNGYGLLKQAVNFLEDIVHKPILKNEGYIFSLWLKGTSDNESPFYSAYIVYFDIEEDSTQPV